MKRTKVVIASILAAVCMTATATDTSVNNIAKLKLDKSNVTQSNATRNSVIQSYVFQKRIAWAFAPVKTEEALLAIAQQQSPLDLLSPDAKERFMDSIVFRSSGLGGFDYSDLEAELTPSQIHSVLSLFGSQHTVYHFDQARVETETDVLLLSKPLLPFAMQQSSVTGEQGIGRPDINAAFADHKGYTCYSRATCKPSVNYICMSRC